MPVAAWAAATRSGYGLLVDEAERIDRLEAGVALARTMPGSRSMLEARRGRQPEVVAACRADPVSFSSCLLNSMSQHDGHLRPQVRRIDVAAGAERGQLDRHQPPLAPVERTRRARTRGPRWRGGAGARHSPAPARRDRGRGHGAADQQRPRPSRRRRASPSRGPSGSGGRGRGRADGTIGPRRRRRPAAHRPPRPRRGARASRSSNRKDGWKRGRSVARRRGGRRGRRPAPGRGRPCRRAGGPQQRLEVAVGDERLDLADVGDTRTSRAVTCGRRRGRRATLRSARWIRTRTAPSDRPRTPAISAVRQLVDEAQDHGLAAVAGQAPDGAPGRARPRRGGPPSASRSSGSDDRPPRPRAAPRAARGAGAPGDSLRAIWNSQTRNVEAPSPSAGWARSSNAAGCVSAGEEGRLGRVLRGVVVAELVVGVAVHLGEVPAIQGVEPGRVAPARPRRAVGRGRDGRAGGRRRRPLLLSSMPGEPSRYTPPRSSRRPTRTWRISPTTTAALRRRRSGAPMRAPPRSASTPTRATVSAPSGRSRRTAGRS